MSANINSKNNAVSILVLLDFVLKDDQVIYPVTPDIGVSILVLLDFVLKAIPDTSKSLLGSVFQSLFYWILFLRKGDLHSCSPGSRFQSLFYWILFLRHSQDLQEQQERQVSILVLLDFVLKGVSEEQLHPDWESFNPCFIGFCS